MDFKQLESFVAVVDEGSFSNAADRLQISQSMVTIHIRNLEAELGIGYIYTRFDKYPCAECGEKIEEDASHHYFGPTKLALSIVYLF